MPAKYEWSPDGLAIAFMSGSDGTGPEGWSNWTVSRAYGVRPEPSFHATARGSTSSPPTRTATALRLHGWVPLRPRPYHIEEHVLQPHRPERQRPDWHPPQPGHHARQRRPLRQQHRQLPAV